jgi:hypothetical protein
MTLQYTQKGWHEKTIGLSQWFFAKKCNTSDSTQIAPRQNSKVHKRNSENLLDDVNQCYI